MSKKPKKEKKKKELDECCLKFIRKGRRCKDCPLTDENE